jgi:hypothetical protein
MTPNTQELSPFPDRGAALVEGDLIDVSATAELENLRYPTAFSRRAYHDLVTAHCDYLGTDPYLRLHEVLSQLRTAYVRAMGTLPLIKTVVPTADSESHFYFAEVWMLQEVNPDGDRRWTVFIREEA